MSGCGSATPPACEPPTPTSPAYECAAQPAAPAWAHDAQFDEEWTLYYAKRAFRALPQDTQTKYETQFDAAFGAAVRADKAFLDAVGAVDAQFPSSAVAALTTAATDLVVFVDSLQTDAGPIDSDARAKMHTSLRSLGTHGS
jgi:hypothetical protein